MGAFALVGMGATFCGTIRAPMTSVLIIVELTSGYGLILPLMIANMSAYAFARYLRPTAIYEALLEQDGIHLSSRPSAQALEQLQLAGLSIVGGDRARVRETGRASDLLRASLPPGQHVFPVVNATDQVVGLITSEDLAILEADPALTLLVTASDIMRPPASVSVEDTLLTALDLMRAERLPELPVLDREGHVLGFVDETTIAGAYLQQTHPSSRPHNG
jgi:CIC family chloride channel protein